jgi:hypothetical protein
MSASNIVADVRAERRRKIIIVEHLRSSRAAMALFDS